MPAWPRLYIVGHTGKPPRRGQPLSSNVRRRKALQSFIVARVQHRFESAQSTQTLAQGLAEYFEVNPMLKRDGDLLSQEAKQFFRSHDTVHVVYGCGTTMPDEAVVKLSSLLGTTGGLAVLRGYMNYETLDIYTKLPVGSTIAALLVSPYLIIRTIWRCARQTQRWPWVEHQEYLHVPLNELRSKFGIKVAHAHCAA